MCCTTDLSKSGGGRRRQAVVTDLQGTSAVAGTLLKPTDQRTEPVSCKRPLVCRAGVAQKRVMPSFKEQVWLGVFCIVAWLAAARQTEPARG